MRRPLDHLPPRSPAGGVVRAGITISPDRKFLMQVRCCPLLESARARECGIRNRANTTVYAHIYTYKHLGTKPIQLFMRTYTHTNTYVCARMYVCTFVCVCVCVCLCVCARARA